VLGNLDPAKLLIILVLALVVLGPERLPRVARQLGAAWRELTRMREQVSEEVRSAMPDVARDLPPIPRLKPGAVSGFLSDLTRPAAAAAAGAAFLGSRARPDGAAPATETGEEGVMEAHVGAAPSSVDGALPYLEPPRRDRGLYSGVGGWPSGELDDPGMN